MKSLSVKLKELIATARTFGLNETDLQNAEEYLSHQEFGLCFDTIIEQMYEYEIAIDDGFFSLVSEAAEQMEIIHEDYIFLKTLIR